MSDHQTFGDWLTIRVWWLAALLFSLVFWFRFLPWLAGLVR